jgi:hypothetical protein
VGVNSKLSKSKGELPHFAVLEAGCPILRETAVQVLQHSVVGHHQDSLCSKARAVLLHQLQSAQTAVETAFAAFEGDGEDLAQDAHVAQAVTLLVQDILAVVWVDLRVLPLLAPQLSRLLPQKPFHFAEIEAFEPALFLLDGTAQVADLGEHFSEFRQYEHVLHIESVGLDEQFCGFQGASEGRDEEDVYLPAVLHVGGGEVGPLGLQHALLAERAVDQPNIVVQVAS